MGRYQDYLGGRNCEREVPGRIHPPDKLSILVIHVLKEEFGKKNSEMNEEDMREERVKSRMSLQCLWKQGKS